MADHNNKVEQEFHTYKVMLWTANEAIIFILVLLLFKLYEMKYLRSPQTFGCMCLCE